MVTAFQEDGSLDEKGIREIVRHNIDHCGVKGLSWAVQWVNDIKCQRQR